MIITQAPAADVPALMALTRGCVASMRAAGIDQWDEVYPDEALIAADVKAGTVHVLRDGVSLVGCVTLDRKPDPNWRGLDWSPPDESAGCVHRLMVHPSHQGHGLAKRLMAHVESLAREQQLRSLRLDAFTQNPPSLRLYESIGYRRTGTAAMRKGMFIGFEKIL